MRTIRFIAFFALFAGASACATERSLAPAASAKVAASSASVGAPQVPLLYVVDGKRLERDQVPSLNADEVSAVKVLKGRAALERYGQDAAYGVVIITTKQAASPST